MPSPSHLLKKPSSGCCICHLLVKTAGLLTQLSGSVQTPASSSLSRPSSWRSISEISAFGSVHGVTIARNSASTRGRMVTADASSSLRQEQCSRCAGQAAKRAILLSEWLRALPAGCGQEVSKIEPPLVSGGSAREPPKLRQASSAPDASSSWRRCRASPTTEDVSSRGLGFRL